MKPLAKELQSVVLEFSTQLIRICERFVEDRIAREQASATGAKKAGRTSKGAASAARRKPCYFPGCKNVAAPRFGMFCAALHKELPQRKKEQIRANRQTR